MEKILEKDPFTNLYVNIIKYFSGTPMFGSRERMVDSMKKKTVRIFFNDDDQGGINLN